MSAAISLWQSRHRELCVRMLLRSWQLAQSASHLACEATTLPGISNVSTDAARAFVPASTIIMLISATRSGASVPVPAIGSDQYTLTAITCTIPAISNMKNSGMCSTCHSENSRT